MPTPDKPKAKSESKQNVARTSSTTTTSAANKHDDSDAAAADAASATYKKLNRFSDLEKRLLFIAFKEHQQIIDIKQRRSSFSSHKQAEVRACWDRIVSDFNEHPETKKRTVRQIQKFWLNSKLRNQIPSVKTSPSTPGSNHTSPRKPNVHTTTPTGTIIKRTIRNDGTIVPVATTPTSITTSYTVRLQTDPDNEAGQMIKSDPSNMEEVSEEMQDEETLEDEDEEDVNNLIELKFIETAQQQQQRQQQQHDHHHQQPQTHQVSFQPAMQIVHHSSGEVQYANVENMEIITQNHQIHHNHQHHHQQHFAQPAGISVTSKSDRRLFCGSDCADRGESESVNALDEHDQQSTDMDPLHATVEANGQDADVMSYAEQMSEIRLQEAQCRLKESHLRCELQQLAVARAKEELKQTREIHELKINEMQLKLDKMKKELRMTLS